MLFPIHAIVPLSISLARNIATHAMVVWAIGNAPTSKESKSIEEALLHFAYFQEALQPLKIPTWHIVGCWKLWIISTAFSNPPALSSRAL